MIAIVDYKMGNVYSIQQSLKFLGVNSIFTNRKSEILSAEKIILPGVGSYFQAMKILNETDLSSVLYEAVIEKGIPILGICLGMQLMAKAGDEDGYSMGLGFYNGEIKRFSNIDLKIPHVGFNLVKKPSRSVLFKGLGEYSDFYFTHSWRLIAPEEDDHCKGICSYGEDFIASFEKEHIFGVQFHPEKSQNNGLLLLKNFIEYSKC